MSEQTVDIFFSRSKQRQAEKAKPLRVVIDARRQLLLLFETNISKRIKGEPLINNKINN